MAFSSIYPNQSYLVLDTVQAGSADVELSNGVLSVGDPLTKVCNYRDAFHKVITASVAEVAQVTTLTPTAANNSTYEIMIQQFDPTTGGYLPLFQHSYTTAASGDTATTISTAFKAAVNAANSYGTLQIVATGTTTIILTAQAGYPVFTVSILQTGGGFTQATGTPGVMPVNTQASLALQGITVANAAYTSVLIEYSPTTGYDNKDNVTLKSAFTLYINEGDGDAAALITTLRYLLDGREVSAAGPANPEAISIV